MSTMLAATVTDRRRFLLGGGLVIAFGWQMLRATSQAATSSDATDAALISGRGFAGFAPNAFIRIGADDGIAFFVPNVEMGQGVYTSQAMLIAEELEVELGAVQVRPMPPDNELYGQPQLQPQTTGGSNSIRRGWEPLRTAGAVARTLLIEAAARRWQVDPRACRAERGSVIHEPSNRRLAYGALAEAAARLPTPKQVTLKQPGDFKLIGQSMPRTDTPEKVDGRARYGIDGVVPGMKVAAVMSSPVIGGRLHEVDAAAALAIPGVRRVIQLPDAVAVIADHYWLASEGLKALQIGWDDGPNVTVDSESMLDEMSTLSEAEPTGVAVSTGNAASALKTAQRSLRATYIQPFLGHAPMEPMSAIVHRDGDRVQVWCGTQVPRRAQTAVAAVFEVPAEKVIVHPQLIGGAFGRRLETDYVTQAAQIARLCEFPVKMIWSREQDTRHDMYRPAYVDRISAGLDDRGAPIAWHHRITGASVIARLSKDGVLKNGVDNDAVEEAANPIYGEFQNMQVEFQQWRPPSGLNVSWWRGVGPTRSVFVVESFIDEIAHSLSRDPYEYRRQLLEGQPRAQLVLDTAAKVARWNSTLPPRTGRGIIVQKSFGSFLAVVCEVFVSELGEVSLRRITAAVDCGLTVNPNIVKQQIEGGILFGLSAALYSEILFEGGRVKQSNFHDYRSLRLNEVPVMEVIHLPSDHPPGGIGETGTTAAAPALTNAIFAAIGVRLRELPVRRTLLKKGAGKIARDDQQPL